PWMDRVRARTRLRGGGGAAIATDGRLSAHGEHTVRVPAGGDEVLPLRKDEDFRWPGGACAPPCRCPRGTIVDHELFNRSQFDVDLAAARSPAHVFKKALQHADAVLKARFEGQRDIHKLIHDRAWLTDQILSQAWASLDCPLDSDIALLAVGGYGRGELHPHSDIDLLILLRDGSAGERYHEAISRFLTLLWDIGLAVGHSVRSISECQQEARSDVTVITNLMESRLLVGDSQLRQEMVDA